MVRKIKNARKFLRPAIILFVLAVFMSTLLLFVYKPKAHAQIFLTSGTTWTVPADWVNTNNSIETIGGGGGAGGGFQQTTGNGGEGGGGGGGGGYSKAVNVILTPGSTVGFSIGTAGGGGASAVSGSAGGDTYICNNTVSCTSISDSAVVSGAKGGALGAAGTSTVVGAGGAGGAAGSGIGTVKFNGGTGGNGGPFSSSTGGGGGGGAGAAGPNAAGNGGVTPSADVHGNGGQGDGSSGGAGGTANSGNGSNGTEYDGSHGSGGGAAGGDGSKNSTGSPGGIGGTYGAGGGAGGGNGRAASLGGAGGAGNQGLIRITYSLEIQSNYRWRLDDGNETSGSSLAAQDTAASINYGTVVRLRFNVENKGDTTSYAYRLEYAPYINGCGAWTAVPPTATTEHFNMFNTSNFTDQAASTNVSSGPAVISDPSGFSFTAGKLVSNTSNSATVTLASGQFTEIEYAFTANSNATNSAYCFRVTNAGTPLDEYDNYPILNINYPPSTPTIYSVVNGTTGAPRLPVFQLKSTDLNNDYLQYVVEECPTNSFPCGGGGHTYDQTSSQACWSIQDAQSATAFAAYGTLSSSTMAYCQMPTTDILTPSTTYYMRAKAIDPGGTNTYSAYSSVATFTTGSLDVQINGGTNINGGTQIGN
jgi:hypothetical protein